LHLVIISPPFNFTIHKLRLYLSLFFTESKVVSAKKLLKIYLQNVKIHLELSWKGDEVVEN